MSNLKKQKLNGNQIGIFFLTGAPLHLGHYQAIIQAKRENDGCVVVLSGFDGDRGEEIGLPLNKRFRYTRELFADDKEVYVTYVNETDIPRYPDGWMPWLEKMKEAVSNSVSNKELDFVWYVGEEDYKQELQSRLQISSDEKNQHHVKLLDRSILPISGTMIRNNPFKYWNYISRPFRRHFSTNVLIAGTASGGKSTLVRDLARSFGAPFTDEYARRYEEESNITDEELDANDFQYLASGQFDNNRKTIQSPSNNGLFIADTNVTVTKMYAKEYLTEKEYQALLPGYEMLEAKEKWDLILIVPPVTQYVDDGFRDMNHSGDAFRWEMHLRLLQLLEDNGWKDRVLVLDAPSGDNLDKQGFYSRYAQARTIVKQFMLDQYKMDLDVRADL